MESRNKLVLPAILALAVWLRFWGLEWGLPFEYQSEEYKIVKYALKMGGGDLNPHFFEYPSLYLYFMLFLYGIYFLAGRAFGFFSGAHDFALSFVKDPTPFYLLGRASEAVCGVLIVALVYRIGKKLFSQTVGWGAALIFAALPHFIYMSHIIKGYMGMTVLLLLFFLACAQIAEEGRWPSYAAAGALLGLAASTRYHAAPFGILLPTAHFYRLYNAPPGAPAHAGGFLGGHGRLLLALALIPACFFVGTPYALITPREFWKDLGGNVDIYASLSGEKTGWASGIFTAAGHFLRFGDVPAPLALGIVCAAGLLLALARWESKHLLILVPVVTYLGVVGRYHHPAGGYLLQVFPIYTVLALHGLFAIARRPLKAAAVIAFLAAAGWNLAEGFQMTRSFTFPDTRTRALSWVQENVPQGSKILIDSKVLAPPLLMSYRQLEKFHKRAVELNHFKKEYLALQLEAHPGAGNGYEIFMVKRTFRQIASLEHQVEEVQKLQDLVDVDGDLGKLKRLGIEYVIVDHWTRDDALRARPPGIGEFYARLTGQLKPLKIVVPEYHVAHGPILSIYKL